MAELQNSRLDLMTHTMPTVRRIATCCVLLAGSTGMYAQQTTSNAAGSAVSFSTAVDMALRNNSRVLAAMASEEKAVGALAQTHDVFIPSLTGGSDLGYSYGFPVGTPTIFSFTAQSLVFNFSQFDYIRAARAGVVAAQLSLKDAKQQVIEDAAYTYIQLDTAVQEQQALEEQYGAAERLEQIVVQRESAGMESHVDVLRAQLTQQQILLKQMHGRNNIAGLREHLARLTGLPSGTLATETASIPATPEVPPALDAIPESPAIQAAYAQARAAQSTAFGDKRQLWRPEISFESQYSRFASFNNYSQYYKSFQSSNFGIGVHISLPVFDAVRRTRARQSAAEAVRAKHEADYLRDQAAEGDLKMVNSLQELSAKQNIARLQNEISAEQLKSIRMQLQNGTNVRNALAPQLSPVDEQNAHIDERGKFVDLLESEMELTHLQLDLLRASGGLESWAHSGTETVTPSK